MADALPTTDDILGAPAPQQTQGNSLPTTDDVLGKPQASTKESSFFPTLGRIYTSYGDAVLSTMKEGGNYGMSEQTQKSITGSAFDNMMNGDINPVQMANEAFFRGIVKPLSVPADIAWRAAQAVPAGVAAGLSQVGKEAGAPEGIGENIIYDIPMAIGASMGFGYMPPQFPQATALEAQANHIFTDEATFMGAKDATPQQAAAAYKAAQLLPETEMHAAQTEAEALPIAQPPTIHEVAFNIGGTTMKDYHALLGRQDNLRTQIADLAAARDKEYEANPPPLDDVKALENKISDLEDRKKLTKSQQARLDDLRNQHTDLLDEIDRKKNADTPEMAKLRQQLQEADYKLRDIAPQVSEAYRQAAEMMPKTETIEASKPVEAEIPKQISAEGISDETRAALYKITQDVSAKLTEAGRTKEEADAAAQLVAAHYQTRSERFGGKLGTPQEMYERDSANIKAGKGKVRAIELAQQAKGKIQLATNEAKATITLMKSADASTFIHETGHHWLDELMRDAERKEAPDDLKADAAAVRKWLGNESGEIETRQHEKFARGFERYLMEGTAPSKSLAGIFAKFKQWLTSIYKTVEKLRSPITDDIRDVFDRLLSTAPEKTIIASEHEPGKMLADIHEADAEHTPPEQAAPISDNIRKEIDSTAKLHEPEIADELKTAESKAEIGGSAVAPASPTKTPIAGQPTGEGGVVAESSAVTSGRGKTAGESGGLREPTNTGTALPKPKSNLVDKAGNIRLDNLNTPEDVNEVLRETATENGDFMGARRGVISDQQALELADALGMDAKTLNLRKIGQAFNSEQILAARKLLIQSAINVRDLMAKAAVGTDEDVIKYAEAKARHIMIQEQVSGITAEAGRALRAFHSLEGSTEAKALGQFLEQATGKTLFQLRKEAKLGSALDSSGKVSKFIQDSQKPSFGDMILEYWTNGLISGPATHTTYMIGNTLLSLWKAVPETAVASLIGKGVKVGEIGAQLKGGVKGIPSALSAAGKALKSGVTTLLPGETAANMPFQPGAELAMPGKISNEAMTWRQLGSDAFGAVKGMRDGFIAAGELVKAGGVEGEPSFAFVQSPLGAIPNVSIKGMQIPVGDVFRVPARAIAAIHSLFRTMNYSMDKAAIAYRSATDEGLTGEKFAARVGELITNPSDEMMKQARGSATNLTLMGQGGKFTQAVSRLTNIPVNLPLLGETRLLKFIDPFVRIGSNIIDQAILQRTPVGLLSSEIRADLVGANGEVAKNFAQARMLTGTALAITVGGMAAEGLVSGSEPSDPKEAAIWRLNGNQAHSIRVGDTWYDIHRLGPLGMLMSISADLYQVAHTAATEDLTKSASMLVHAFTQNILDESFMRGPADIIKAVSDSDRYGQAWMRNFIASFVPFSVGMTQTARAIDPYTRQARTVMDAIRAKIPWESEALQPRRDIWGEPIPNRDVLGAKGFSAIYESKIKNDPVNQALQRLGMYPSQPSRKIRGVTLTDQQYDDYCRIAGKQTKMMLNILVHPGFELQSPGSQIKMIKKTLDTAREMARSQVMALNPSIIKQAMQNKKQAVTGIK